MLARTLATLGVVLASFVILFVSITQTAQVKYSFNAPTSKASEDVLGDATTIEYYFPFPGRVLPDHPLWPVKALRDRLWIMITPNTPRRAQVNLLFANKRLVASKILFERNKPELAYSVLVKAEQYLQSASQEEENARRDGVDTKSFLLELSRASLKHREEIIKIKQIAPDDAKPLVVKVEDISKRIFESVKNAFVETGMTPPDDPFESD